MASTTGPVEFLEGVQHDRAARGSPGVDQLTLDHR
jgi:hypothetical protein